MTVWQLLWALLGHVLHGRGRQPVYVVTDDLPEPVQHDLDDRDLAIVQTYASYRTHNQFVVVIAKPESVEVPGHAVPSPIDPATNTGEPTWPPRHPEAP